MLNTFIISLKNGKLIHHKPDNIIGFASWLAENRLRNVARNQGKTRDIYAMAG